MGLRTDLLRAKAEAKATSLLNNFKIVNYTPGPAHNGLGYNEQVSSSCIFSLVVSRSKLYEKRKHVDEISFMLSPLLASKNPQIAFRLKK